jgi:hypothetical protein
MRKDPEGKGSCADLCSVAIIEFIIEFCDYSYYLFYGWKIFIGSNPLEIYSMKNFANHYLSFNNEET